MLLKAGADPDHADNDGWTPLRSSAWAGHTEVSYSDGNQKCLTLPWKSFSYAVCFSVYIMCIYYFAESILVKRKQ